MSTSKPAIGVIGAGAWGTALAILYARNDYPVTLWVRRPELAAEIKERRINRTYLPDQTLPDNIAITTEMADLDNADIWFLVTPAQTTRQMVQQLRNSVPVCKPMLLCSKGVEIEHRALLHDVVKSVWPACPVGLLNGPTFAADIAKGRPSAMTLAMNNGDLGRDLVQQLTVRTLRLYRSDDIIGAEIGGAVKNVLAIACGIVHGLGLGESARAALITRGLAEIGRLAESLGGRRETLLGLCGVGDIMLTCSSIQSRNFSLGLRLGEGDTLENVMKSRVAVTEGVTTAPAVAALAMSRGISMPIVEAVNAVLSEEMSAADVVNALLNRPGNMDELA
jgi:glycerol-3-phosphate dehydrogenase (NAD(P)+)